MKLASRGAADKYIPLSVLVKEQSGIEGSDMQAVSITQWGQRIRVSADQLQQVLLYSASGMYVGQYNAENGAIETPELSRGIYLLQVTTAGTSTTHKLIVR